MFERFTRSARAVVRAAVGEAERRGDHYVGNEHLLVGLVLAPSAAVRQAVGFSVDELRAGLNELDQAALTSAGIAVEPAPADSPTRQFGRRRHRPFTGGAKQVLKGALDEAVALGDRHLGPEHMLLAMTQRPPRDISSQLLSQLGVSGERLRADLLRSLNRSA